MDPVARDRAVRWMAELRAARYSAGFTQQDVATALGVRKSTVNQWENGHLASWERFCAEGREIGVRLVVVDQNGCVRDGLAEVVAGEPWARTELRRLAGVLRGERKGAGRSRASLAAEVGVSLWSFAHLERGQLNPRLVVLSAWVGSLKCDIRWQPVV
ncbi:helix-turn-helix transcriptional regulator [Actinospica sp. MGRD01-02]|uniref:Helix-turn-helix transcriptional regulator n=1 Tax=Actinospica acidithermotolerans TaxID=2828514 RepID=A0A941EFK6_9ACTN|nr:helix-turn-helix transcriptional regulator [Actinospica acidithermotolerans]MBR7828174.1 helix-turn-helix transcriptional regulator [Actinospica acidithermotolerans]